MSGLTPEAARAAAEWLKLNGYLLAPAELRAKADRLEAAAKTPGQVLAEVRGLSWAVVLSDSRKYWEEAAAAVIAHHVGPDRVVVDRYAALNAVDEMDGKKMYRATLAAFREALS